MAPATRPAASAPAGSTAAAKATIVHPDNTTRHKLVRIEAYTRYDTTGGQLLAIGGEWLSAAAVTSVVLTAGSGNFVSGSVATLYGLA